jgi:hypothetical protein
MGLWSFPGRVRFAKAAQNSGTPARGTRAIALMAALALAGCGPDGRQLRLCERVFAELEDAARYLRVGAEALPAEAPGVALVYRARAGGGAARFVCRFRGARFAPGQAELVGVTRLSGEPLSDLALGHLRRRVGLE